MITVMTYAGDNGPTFTGPFPNQDAAAIWGRQWSVDNHDDPRWQIMYILCDYFNRNPMLRLPPE